jgi:sarcosine oxidase
VSEKALPDRADVVVVGLGAAGSAALSFLARAGAKALGIDLDSPPHTYGSSHGETRMLRTAYSEGAAYVPMVRRAIELWRALEVRTGTSLLRQTGVAYHGPQSSEFIAGARESAQRWNVELTDLAKEGAQPRLAVPPDWQFLLDRDGGYLDAEASITAFLNDANTAGAMIIKDCCCVAFDIDAAEIVIATTLGSVRCDHVIIAAGAWVGELLPALRAVTHIERRVSHWYADPHGRCDGGTGFTPFLATTEDDSAFYGFPANACGEVKVAEHFVAEKVVSPDVLNRSVLAKDIDLIQPLVSRFLPDLGEHLRAAVCMYPMSRDEHFIVDHYPNDERLIVAAGLSGHGFKFAPVIGEALANLAMGAEQEIDVDFFSVRRFPEFR